MLTGALAGALLLEADLWIPLAAIAAGSTVLAWVARGVGAPAVPRSVGP
ncbi:MAG TPA: hypothetical protein VK501_06925 [Baekduia sp.]|nr:hypothetical protein [Baekduia sp.]HMJ33633.1 hypothetical protein [Baekduia sp.]